MKEEHYKKIVEHHKELIVGSVCFLSLAIYIWLLPIFVDFSNEIFSLIGLGFLSCTSLALAIAFIDTYFKERKVYWVKTK